MKVDLFSEMLNGVIFVLLAYAVGVFCAYILRNRGEDYRQLRPALALLAVFSGEMFVRFGYWMTRHVINTGGHANRPLFYLYATVGGVLTGWGILCVMRVFAHRDYTTRIWKIALASAVIWTLLWSIPYIPFPR